MPLSVHEKDDALLTMSGTLKVCAQRGGSALNWLVVVTAYVRPRLFFVLLRLWPYDNYPNLNRAVCRYTAGVRFIEFDTDCGGHGLCLYLSFYGLGGESLVEVDLLFYGLQRQSVAVPPHGIGPAVGAAVEFVREYGIENQVVQ